MSVYGFIVGIEKYEDKRLDVPGPARNAVEMAKWLLGLAPPRQLQLFVEPLPIPDADGPKGLTVERQKRLHDDIAALQNEGVNVHRTGNRDPIEKFWQRQLAEGVDFPSKLFIFWSGHGLTGGKLSRIFRYSDYHWEARSPIFHATNALNELDTERFAAFDSKIFLADACGNFPRDPPADHVTDFKVVMPRTTIGFFASRSGEFAKSRNGMGVFTELMLPILQGCAGWPTEKELVDGIDKATQGTDVLPFTYGGRTPAREYTDRQVGTPEPGDQTAIDAGRLAAHRVALQRLFAERMTVHEGGAVTADAAAHWYRLLNVRGQAAVNNPPPKAADAPPGEPKGAVEGPLADIIGAAGEGVRILLLGGGGSGKSTAVLHLASQAAEVAERDRGAPIPLYIELAPFDAGRTIGGGFERLLQMVTNAAARLGLDRPALEALWRGGGRPLLFLLDGLNEIAPDFQESCLLAIRELASHGAPHRYLVTSRPGGGAAERLGSSEGRFAAYDALAIGPNEVRAYLDARGLAGLYERLGDRLRALAGTPFLLMALAQSCAGRKPGEMPANLGQLYRGFIDRYVFEKREPAKPNAPTRYDYPAVKRPLCAFLAERMTAAGGTRLAWDGALEAVVAARLETIHDAHRRTRRVMPADDWRVDELFDELAANGLLDRVPDGNGLAVAFAHQSVQEYFAAIADEIDETPTAAVAGRVPPLIWHQVIFDWHNSPRASAHPRWTPTIMLAGLASDASPLLRSLRTHNPVLAADCLRAATTVEPALRAELLAEWASWLDSPAPNRRWVGCLCLGGAGAASPAAISRLGEIAAARRYPAEHYVVLAAAIEALEAIDPAGRELLARIGKAVATNKPFHSWSDLPLPREKDRAIDLLVAAWLAAEPGSKARGAIVPFLASPEERGNVDRVVDAALRDSAEERTRSDIAELRHAIDRLPQDAAISNTVIKLGDLREIRQKALRMLEERLAGFAGAPIPELIAFLQATDWQRRSAAAVEIATRRAPETFGPVMNALIDEPQERVAEDLAKAAASQMTDPAILRQFEARLAGDDTTYLFTLDETWRPSLMDASLDDDLRDAFARGGVVLSNNERIYAEGDRWLIESPDPRRNALSQCYSVADEHGALRVHRLGVRGRIAAVLRYVEGAEVRPILESSIAAPEPPVRAAAVTGLAAIGGPSAAVAASWRDAFDDPSATVRLAAVAAQAKLLGPSAARPLAKRLEEETNATVAVSLIETLGTIASEDAIDALIKALLRLKTEDEQGEGKLWIDDGESSLEPSDTAWGTTRTPGWAKHFHDALQTPLGRTRVLARMRRVLVDGQRDERVTAAYEIGRWLSQAAKSRIRLLPEEDELLPPLLQAVLADPSLSVRRAAALALRWSNGDRAPRAIARELGSGKIEMRASAVVALGRLANEAVADALRRTARTDNVPMLRILAARALAQIGFAEPLPDDAARLVVDAALNEGEGIMRSLARAALNDIPGAWDAYFGPVYAAIDTNDPENALALLEPRLSFPLIDPTMQGLGDHLRAQALIALGRFEESLVALERASKLLFMSTTASLQAMTYSHLGRWKDAQDAAQKAVDHDYDNSEHHVLLGWYAYCAGDFATSMRASLRAVKIDRTLLAPRFNFALARLASGESRKALAGYRRALETNHKDRNHRREVIVSARDDLDDLMQSRQDLINAIESVLVLFDNAM